MRTESGSNARQWLWFVLLWAAGVAVFGGAMWLLRSAMGLLM